MTGAGGAPVVVGVDGGPSGSDALRLARWAAHELGERLVVAVVHPAPAALGSGRVDAEWVAERREVARRVLDGARRDLGDDPGVPVEYRTVASGSAAHGLHDLAEQVHAATIVVGSGRAAPPQRLFAGSTAQRLLAGAACPVTVAPRAMAQPPGTAGRVGVAYVDTPDGRAALAFAHRLARRTGSALRLVTVVSDATGSRPFLVGPDAEHAVTETARETYEAALSAAAATVTDVAADTRVLTGDVVATLADLPGVDVLCCGSRGYGPARRVLLGGVSGRLVRAARHPLVVVPRSG